MSLRLTNTLTRMKERFVPADPDRVKVHICGPTVAADGERWTKPRPRLPGHSSPFGNAM